jgi:uncharacterized membrane protein YkvA (DUF1232 family)
MGKSLISLIRIINYLKADDVSLGKKLLFLVPVIYLLLPFDLIGDFFPLAGQLDDVAVFILMWPILKRLLSNYYGNGSKDASSRSKKKYRDAIDIDEDDYDIK